MYPQEYDIYDPAAVDVPDNVPPQFRAFAAREIADYYAMTTALDDCMKDLLAGLEALGIADETIVCFSSDHGDHLSAHGYGKPGDPFDTGRRLPATDMLDLGQRFTQPGHLASAPRAYVNALSGDPPSLPPGLP